MAHRGPDGEGVHFDGALALGHRRLSIIDSEGGGQPMHWADGQLSLVFNGEIYNFSQVADELRGHGVQFRSRSDTEVILAAYWVWGRECVHRFVGMFAFALWDSRDRSLWVVRDRLGVKPVYWWSDTDRFACASAIGPLLDFLRVRKELNEGVLDSYLTLGYVPAPETMFRGILKLEPGHSLLVRDGRVSLTRYWDFADCQPEDGDPTLALERMDELLRDAVQKCLVSDVPIGALLSGGLDSSAVVALMSETGVDPINAFTAGFSSRHDYSEERFARMVAEHFHCRHFVHDLDASGFEESLKFLVQHTEEPLVEPSGTAVYWLCRLARSETTVLLSGEGADEIFGGYHIYQRMLQIERWRPLLTMMPWKALQPLRSLLGETVIKHSDWFRKPLTGRFRGTSGLLTDGLRNWLYKPEFQRADSGYLGYTFERHFERVKGHPSALGRMQYVDIKTWLADDLLIKADKMSMAASVELRVPFLDHRLVEAAVRLPDGLKIRQSEGKVALRRLMGSRLPKEILLRRKMGFPIPVKNWFGSTLRNYVKDQLLTGQPFPWLQRRALEELAGDRKDPGDLQTRLILSLLILRRWIESPP